MCFHLYWNHIGPSARTCLHAALLGGMGLLPAVHAAHADSPGLGPAVSAAALEEARGGFETPGGLSLSLGIERVVSVNGEVLSRSSFAIPDLSSMTAEQARQAQEAFGAARLVQIGAGSTAAPDTGLGGGATLVQNTLDGQAIRTDTVINSTLNSMSLLKDLNFQSTMREALLRSTGN